MATTFQIFNENTNTVMDLNDVDRLYCESTGCEYSHDTYAPWYTTLENVLYTYADLFDHDTYIVKHLGGKKAREIPAKVVAKLLAMLCWQWLGYDDEDTLLANWQDYYLPICKFWKEHPEFVVTFMIGY